MMHLMMIVGLVNKSHGFSIEIINHNQHTTFETSVVLITVIIIEKYLT